MRQWRRKDPGKARTETPLPGWLTDLLYAASTSLSGVFEILLWVVVALLLAGLIYYFARDARLPAGRRTRRTETKAPEVLFGLDVREESLPSDIAGAVLEMLKEGRVTEALSLLYRGTLARLVHREQMTVEASWTEADCLAQARPHLSPERFEVFKRLTGDWCRSAYAHRPPEPAALEELCREWGQAFGVGGA